MCKHHGPADTLVPGVCLQCGIYPPAIPTFAQALWDKAEWFIIAASSGYVLAHLAAWWALGFRIVS